MPKMKTNSSAKKRFKVTGSGRVRRGTAGLSHLMIGKSANRRRGLRKHQALAPLRVSFGGSRRPRVQQLSC
jgi:large subunit ribosomal protein L35